MAPLYFVQVTTECTLSGNLVGNVTGQNPLIGPLQYNGDSMSTHTRLQGSPSIDAGNPATPGNDPAGLPHSRSTRPAAPDW